MSIEQDSHLCVSITPPLFGYKSIYFIKLVLKIAFICLLTNPILKHNTLSLANLMLTLYKQYSFHFVILSRTCTKSRFLIRKHSLLSLKCFLKAPTRTTFRWYRISYFLKTLWLTTSSLVTCSKTPSCQRKKKVSEEVYHVCPKNLNNFSGGFYD